MTPAAPCPSIHHKRENDRAPQHETGSSHALPDGPTPHDQEAPRAPHVMRDSLLTHRRRQRDRLQGLVDNVTATCDPATLLQVAELVHQVDAGQLAARDAHEQILRLDRANQKAA